MICFAVCRGHPQGHVGRMSGTRRSNRKALRPIFSVRIYVIRELAALLMPSWSCRVFGVVASCDGVFRRLGGIDAKYAVHLISQPCVVISLIIVFHVGRRISSGLVVAICRTSREKISSGIFFLSQFVFARRGVLFWFMICCLDAGCLLRIFAHISLVLRPTADEWFLRILFAISFSRKRLIGRIADSFSRVGPPTAL